MLITIPRITSTDMIGYIAGTLTSVAFIPQAFDIGPGTYLSFWTRFSYGVYLVGILGWIIYGGRLRSIPIVLFNCISFIILSYTLIVTSDQPKLQ
jgi:MtN3 and saliva related transmembrane protein